MRCPLCLFAVMVMLLSVLAPLATAEEKVAAHISAALPLAGPEDLADVSMSILDRKLAMSLAVETHVQIELAEFALQGVRDDELKRLVTEKLQHYRSLLAALDNLTGGDARSMLARAVQASQRDEARSDADSDDSPDSAATAERRAAPHPVRKPGGLKNVVENATTSVIYRVRLAIAAEYGELLRAELANRPPAEFERRYLAIETCNLMQVLAMLRVFEAQASEDFARVIHLATAAAEGHVLKARQSAAARQPTPRPTGAAVDHLVKMRDGRGS